MVSFGFICYLYPVNALRLSIQPRSNGLVGGMRGMKKRGKIAFESEQVTASIKLPAGSKTTQQRGFFFYGRSSPAVQNFSYQKRPIRTNLYGYLRGRHLFECKLSISPMEYTNMTSL